MSTVTDTNADQGESFWIEPDGRYGHKFRQSELGNYVGMCPEQTRRDRANPEMRRESDASSIGSGVHAGIEYAIDQLFQGEQFVVGEMQWKAIQEFQRYVAMPNYVAIQHEPKKSVRLVEEACMKWFDQVMPKLRPVAAEIPFRRLVLHEDDQRVIYASGTIDYLDERIGLVDWKTASSPFKQWEKQRWNIQASMYTWAADQLGLTDPDRPWTFTFIIMIHGNPVVQTIPVTRDAWGSGWLKEQALSMAYQVEANSPSWNKNDAGWWCSTKWCPHFADCKGKYIEI